MPYRPPKGVRPPQLEGKRTGRPRGSKNLAGAWRDVLWGYQNAGNEDAEPPSGAARLWQAGASGGEISRRGIADSPSGNIPGVRPQAEGAAPPISRLEVPRPPL